MAGHKTGSEEDHVQDAFCGELEAGAEVQPDPNDDGTPERLDRRRGAAKKTYQRGVKRESEMKARLRAARTIHGADLQPATALASARALLTLLRKDAELRDELLSVFGTLPGIIRRMPPAERASVEWLERLAQEDVLYEEPQDQPPHVKKAAQRAVKRLKRELSAVCEDRAQSCKKDKYTSLYRKLTSGLKTGHLPGDTRSASNGSAKHHRGIATAAYLHNIATFVALIKDRTKALRRETARLLMRARSESASSNGRRANGVATVTRHP